MAEALEHLLRDADLWLYFENGGDLPQQVFEMLRNGGQSRTADRLASLCVLAPHGPAISEAVIEQVAGVVAAARDPWLPLATILLPQEHLEVLGWRLLDASVRMGSLGGKWIESLGTGESEARRLLFQALLGDRVRTTTGVRGA
jgi:hypothetical protein